LWLVLVMALDTSIELAHLSSDNSHPVTNSTFLSQALKYAYEEKGEKAIANGWKPLSQTRENLILSDAIPQSDCKQLIDGFIEGAIHRPATALRQVIGDEEQRASDMSPAQPSINSSRQTGRVLGKLIPFVGIVGITREASAVLLGEYLIPPLFRVMGEQATAGFMMGALLTPSELQQGKGLFSTRLSQGGLSAATFATMTGTAASLNRELPKADEDSAISKIVRGISLSFLTGAVGEMVDTEGLTYFGTSIDTSIPVYACTGVLDSANKSMCRLLEESKHAKDENKLKPFAPQPNLSEWPALRKLPALLGRAQK
jgi:hypothetical protein